IKRKMKPGRNGAMKTRPPRVDIASLRREEIVDAAAAIIEHEGIQSLSLSEIEARTGMSRGQLTYYFPEKELILLAVFDRMVSAMRKRGRDAHGDCAANSAPDLKRRLRRVMEMVLSRPKPDEFTALQYAFLAQMRHRADFRERLAALH